MANVLPAQASRFTSGASLKRAAMVHVIYLNQCGICYAQNCKIGGILLLI